MNNLKIPKIIHYCWFGNGEKSELAKQCIEKWKLVLPDYKIIEWNEKNFDISSNEYVLEAYKGKKYAFVSDYVRLYSLFKHGGIYLDTDVEVLKNFDELLNLSGFAGFEDSELVSTAIIGSEKRNPLIKEWLDTYNDRHFLINGKKDETTNVRVFTNRLLKHGMIQNNKIQNINGDWITIFPIEYFSPLKIGSKKPKITNNTFTIHWFEGTWLTLDKKIKIKIISLIKMIIGFKNYNKLKKIVKRW